MDAIVPKISGSNIKIIEKTLVFFEILGELEGMISPSYGGTTKEWFWEAKDTLGEEKEKDKKDEGKDSRIGW